MEIQAIVTDIEGTTSDIAFVKDTLFPYAAAALPDFVRRHADDPKVREILQETAVRANLDPNDLEALISQLLRWIEDDRKITALKTIQGMIWETGYREGAFRAPIYPDAHEALVNWHKAGIPLYVYSSGSVKAQQLFFEHSIFGDLRYLFRGYFDTTTGAKTDAKAYFKIASSVALLPLEILFLSDIREELDAAKNAGFKTCWLIRKGSEAPKDTGPPPHPCVQTFTEISL